MDVINRFVLVVEQFTLRDGALDKRSEVDSQSGDLLRVLATLLLEVIPAFEGELLDLFSQVFNQVFAFLLD